MKLASLVLLLLVTRFHFQHLPPMAQLCSTDDGELVCRCTVNVVAVGSSGQLNITISDCRRHGGWSAWGRWSRCRNGWRRRRRRCDRPSPIGPPSSACRGDSHEKSRCSSKATSTDIVVGGKSNRQRQKSKPKGNAWAPIPNHFWGVWTDWSEWSDCDCSRNLRMRSRHCRGESCESCPIEYDSCPKLAQTCPMAKKWAPWTEWAEHGDRQMRYRAFCSSNNPNSVEVGFRPESRELAPEQWSPWDVRPGVAFRHRRQGERLDVEHQLMVRAVDHRVPVGVVLASGIVCVVAGFCLQCFVAGAWSRRCGRRGPKDTSSIVFHHCKSPGFASLISKFT